MKKLSLSGIAIALLIGSFYTFVFCMTDSIDNSDISQIQYTQVTDTYETVFQNELKNENTDGFLETSIADALISDIKNSAASSLEDTEISSSIATSATTTPTPTPTTTKVTTAKTSITTKIPVVKPETTLSTDKTTVPLTTTPPKTTTTSVTTGNNADFNETLSVTVNGSSYTGNAFDIVCKVVYSEMPEYFHTEAIKAQAVATYSYIKYSNQNGVKPAVSFKSAVPSKVSDAVRSVFGQTAYYNGMVAQTVYCASSGGYTSSAKNVWGNNVPYLVSVKSEYDTYDPNYGVTKTFSEDYVKNILTNAGFNLSDNPENWITLLPAEQGGILDGGYIGKLLIDGQATYNGSSITGRVLREKIFNFQLRSAKFDVKYSNGNFIFTTYGYGHGVGMSQNGANLYATKGGYNYLQILKHYYTGITIK